VHYRYAHRRHDRTRSEASCQPSEQSPGAHWGERYSLLECAPPRPAIRLRRDPRTLAEAGKPRHLRAPTRLRPWQDGGGHYRLGGVRARCRYRGRGLATEGARTPPAHRLDQARGTRHPLWHDERGGAFTDRYYGQDRGRRLGPVQGRNIRIFARPRRRGEAVGAHASCRAGRDRCRSQAGPRVRPGDHSLLASGTLDQRHRTRPHNARKSAAPGPRAAAAFCVTAIFCLPSLRPEPEFAMSNLARLLCLLLLAFALPAGIARAAEAYPSKPIRLIVPFPPGG